MATSSARHRLMTETYEDVELLIWDVVHEFQRKNGNFYGTKEELFSEGCVAFVKAYQRYDPSRGCSFPTFVRSMVNFHLMELVRSETKRRVRIDTHSEVTPVDPSPQPFSLSEFVDELSEDARAIVSLVLETPNDLLHAMQEDEYNGAKYLLRQYLSGMGWAKERIADCFNEIAHVLA